MVITYHQRLLCTIYCHHQSTSAWRSLSPTFTVYHLLSSPIYLSLEISITNVYCMPSTVITNLPQPGDLYHQGLLCNIYCHHQSTSAWRSLSPTFTVYHLLSSPIYLTWRRLLLYAIYCHHQSTSTWRSLSPTFTACHLLSSPIYLSLEISITNVYCVPSTVITNLPQPGDLYHQRLLCTIYCHHQSTSAWRSLSPTFTVCHLLSSPVYLSLEISITKVYCVTSTVITNLPQPGDLYHQRLLYAIYCHHQSTSAWRSLSPRFTV